MVGWGSVLFVFWATAGACLRLRFALRVSDLGFSWLDGGWLSLVVGCVFLFVDLFVGTV